MFIWNKFKLIYIFLHTRTNDAKADWINYKIVCEMLSDWEKKKKKEHLNCGAI